MKKTLVVLFAILIVATAAWGAPDALLGPHNVGEAGCNSCHAPHNALPGQSFYLWGRAIPTGAYNTYGGGTVQLSLNAGGQSTDTAQHTILCLSCHDITFSGLTSITDSTTLGANKAIGKGGDLSHDHPVHVAYPMNDPTFFNVTISGSAGNYNVAYADAAATTFAYGHPARLYSSDGTSAYLECSSCHNPHAWHDAVQTTSGGKTQVTTVYFLRGAYASGSSTTNYNGPNFCMSCHMFPAAAFDGSVH